jgi:hypothetical protein
MNSSRHVDLRRIVRRSLVAAGVTASLIVGASAIRTAADWTAEAGVKQDAPAGIVELQARISAEQTRSEALRSRIDQLAASSRRLAELIDRAEGETSLDEVAAGLLESDLSMTQAALTALTEQAAKATPRPATRTTRTASTTRSTTTATTTVRRSTDDDDDDEHEREHDD